MTSIQEASLDDRQYKILFESNPNPMWIYDLESLEFLAVNDAAVFKYGYTKEEFFKMTLKDIRPAAEVDSLLKNINRHSESYQSSSGWKHLKKDGTILDVEILSHDVVFAGKNARLVSVNDITEKKRTEEALQEAEYRYRSTLDNMMEGFQIISRDWKYLYVNDVAAKQGRSTKNNLLNHTMMEMYPGIESTTMFAALRKSMDKGIPQSMDNEFIYPDRSKRWFHLNIEPIPEGILILSSDITDEKIAKIEVYRLNRVYAVLSNINQAIVRIKDKQMLFDTACKIAVEDGKFKMAWIGMLDEKNGTIKKISSAGNADVYLENLDKPKEQQSFWKSAAAETIKTGDYLILNDLHKADEGTKPRDGQIHTTGYNSAAIFPLKTFNKVKGIFSLYSEEKDFFEQSEIALFTEMVQDISFSLETMEIEYQRMKAEADLIDSERRFFNAFEYAAIGMAIVDLKGNFIRVNNALCNLSGYSNDELLTKSFSDITHKDDIETDLIQVKRMLSKEIDTYQAEKRYIHKLGQVVWIMLNSSLLRDKNGDPLYFIAQMQDITAKKKVELEIISAKEKAEEMSRLKSNFLANMSHELRTPMIGILGTAELFKESESIEEIRDFIPTFEESAQRLLRTLNQILNISKLEAEKIDLQRKDIIIDEIIERSTSLFKLEASKKSLSFDLDIKERGIVVNLDEDLFVHILDNLSDNAIKFTSEGGITIHVGKKIIKGSEYAEIIVRDTGIGIPGDKYDLIFEPFRQASEGLARQHEGTGLGLTLAKKYTEMMDGEIRVESVPGKGSSFILHFPLAEVSTKNILHDTGNLTLNELSAEFPSVKILYIDDDKVAHKFIGRFLSGICKVESCYKGEDAIDLIQRNKYHILLIDINLGYGMSGIDLAKKIREIEYYKEVPLIAITGFAMMGDKEKFLSQGFDYYIAKPIGKAELRRFMINLIQQKG